MYNAKINLIVLLYFDAHRLIIAFNKIVCPSIMISRYRRARKFHAGPVDVFSFLIGFFSTQTSKIIGTIFSKVSTLEDLDHNDTKIEITMLLVVFALQLL